MGAVRLSSYRRFVAGVTVLLGLIVLTGAAVRLTQAGLGCSEWPNCHEGQLLPEEEDLLGLIEYGNRMLSGIVGIACIGAVVLARRLQPRRPDLVRWSWGLVAGSAAQVVLGAAVVRLELDPIAVAGHFILSMVMLWNVLVLYTKTGWSPRRGQAGETPSTINHGRVVVALGSLVLLVTGTMVTGTGPNSGDSRAERLGFDFATIARTHSVLVWLFVAALVWLAVRLARGQQTAGSTAPDPARDLDPIKVARWLLIAAVAQGAIGYWQYLTGVPPLLVEFHILGSVLVWSLTVLLYLNLFRRTPVAAETVDLVDVSAGVVEGVEPMQHLLDR